MKYIVILLLLFLPILGGTQTPRVEKETEEMAMISGRVMLLPLHAPASGSVVSFYLMQEQSESIVLRLAKSVRPDKDGNYEVRLGSGKYLVRARQPGFLETSAWDFYVARQQKKVLDFNLIVTGGDFEPGFRSTDIVGSIQSSTNAPVSNATVTAVNIDDCSQVFQTRSDSRGKYLLKPEKEGRYVVYAFKPGFNLTIPLFIQVPSESQFEIPSHQLKILLEPQTGNNGLKRLELD
jgi:hypothetical protein